MGKTYEALERAEKDFEAKWLSLPRTGRKQTVAVYQKPSSPRSATECYEELKTNLLSASPQESIKTILFAGTNHGDGTSTTAINFAHTLAGECEKKVLLMDVNLRTPSLHEVFQLKPNLGLSDLVTPGRDPEPLLRKVDPGNLHVVTCGGNNTSPMSLFRSAPFSHFLRYIRSKFDYVVLDAPPIPSFSETRILSALVDGVILVIAAGRTREQVARRAKQDIQEAGGKLLGVVLNRRRFYIPDWIYKRL